MTPWTPPHVGPPENRRPCGDCTQRATWCYRHAPTDKRMGRPTSLTTEVRDRFINLLQVGNYFETACAAAGISKNTAKDWMKRGARALQAAKENPSKVPKADRPFVDFLTACEKAMGEAEALSLGQIAKAAAGGAWQANAWRLERMHADRYGRKDRVAHEGVLGGAPIVVQKVDVKAIQQTAVPEEGETDGQ